MEIDGVHRLNEVPLLCKGMSALVNETSFRVRNHELNRKGLGITLQQVQLNKKSRLTTAGTSHYQNIFVPRILGVGRSVAHHQTFSFRQNDVVLELRSLKRLNVLGIAP